VVEGDGDKEGIEKMEGETKRRLLLLPVSRRQLGFIMKFT